VQELGLHDIRLELALPDFRYRAEHRGIVENEICPVFIGLCTTEPSPNPDEVAAVDWIDWEAFSSNDAAYADYSPWSKWEATELRRIGILGNPISR
jgi:isopentenyl-diphosphate delta-isomerase